VSAATLPPWGYMEKFVEEELATRPYPEAWIPQAPGQSAVEFSRFFDTLLHEIKGILWPEYLPASGTWSSTPDQALIDADFDIMADVHRQLREPISGGLLPKDHLPTHEKMFLEEDDEDTIFGHEYHRYDPGIPKHLADDLTDILWTGCDRKMGSIHYQLKQRLQRPRPKQVAFIQNREFHWIVAKTGETPSMVSGHSLQGCMGGCSAYLMFGGIDPVSVGYLQQLTVDIGDRRVFAGVHYPSDNLSSWYTAFKLIPHVIEQRDVARTKAFLREALETKSVIFDAVRRHIQANAYSPYVPAMTAIQKVW